MALPVLFPGERRPQVYRRTPTTPPEIFHQLSSSPSSRTRLVLIGVRILWGSLFAFSGILKLVDLEAFRRALEAFAILPASTLTLAAHSISLLECTLGALVALGIRTREAAAGLLLLLLAFTAAVALKVAEGAALQCGCFGSLDSSPIGIWSLVRNFVLLGIGVLVLSSPRIPAATTSHPDRMQQVSQGSSKLQAPSALAAIIICGLLAVSLGLALQNRSLKRSLQILTEEMISLKVGDGVQRFTAATLKGRDTTIAFDGGSPTILFVMRTTCRPCAISLPLLDREFGTSTRLGRQFVIVSMDSLSATAAYLRIHDVRATVVCQPEPSFRDHYKILATPQTLVIRADTVAGIGRSSISADIIADINNLLGNQSLPHWSSR